MDRPRLTAAVLAAQMAALAACAPGSSRPTGPVVSPTGVVYEPGTPPAETRYSQTAALYLRSGQEDRAVQQALQGLETDPGNPIHHFLGGVAHVRLGEYARADSMFRAAERLYPAYELEVEPERLAAWAEAFNRGAEAFAEGRTAEARTAWEGATRIYDLRPEAHRNLAMLLADEGEYEAAAELYRRALSGLERRPATRVLDAEATARREHEREAMEEGLVELLLRLEEFAEVEPLLRRRLAREPGNAQVRLTLATAVAAQGRREEAAAIFDELLSEPGLSEAELLRLGVQLFRLPDFPRAARAFGRLAERQPHSRDVWFNYVNALFAAEDWGSLVATGDRYLELDPLNENGALIVARGHLETGDEQAALRHVRRIEAAPLHVDGLLMRPVGPGTVLEGRIVGNEADEGSPVTLRFVFYGEEGPLGEEPLTVSSPAPGRSEGFELRFPLRASAFRYELAEGSR